MVINQIQDNLLVNLVSKVLDNATWDSKETGFCAFYTTSESEKYLCEQYLTKDFIKVAVDSTTYTIKAIFNWTDDENVVYFYGSR